MAHKHAVWICRTIIKPYRLLCTSDEVLIIVILNTTKHDRNTQFCNDPCRVKCTYKLVISRGCSKTSLSQRGRRKLRLFEDEKLKKNSWASVKWQRTENIDNEGIHSFYSSCNSVSMTERIRRERRGTIRDKDLITAILKRSNSPLGTSKDRWSSRQILE